MTRQQHELDAMLKQVSTIVNDTNENMKRMADENAEMRALIARLAGSLDQRDGVREGAGTEAGEDG